MKRERKRSSIIKNIPVGEADVVLLGVPNDRHSSGWLGSALAPRLICDQLYYQVEELMQFSGREGDEARVCDQIAIAEKHLAVEEMLPKTMVKGVMEEAHDLICYGKYVVSLGGSHSVSIGSVAAHHRFHPGMSVVQLDAHLDFRKNDGDFMQGKPDSYAHCTVMRHVHAMNIPIIQAGIRVDSDIELGYIRKNNLERNIFRANLRDDNDDIVEAIRTHEVYLTLDIDVLDSALVATGTPENRGWSWGKLYDFLEMLFSRKRVVGFDIIEVCPGPDFDRARGIQTCYEVAQLIYWMLWQKFRSKFSK
ncbi:MAG: arginase family protein [Candidatus Moranbacteria bacterium]|nr:arginase family protein [Candidatus Moranbacteria bacterium]